MDQVPCNHDHADNKSDAKARDKGCHRRNKFKWAWDFWSNHPAPIILLFFGGLLMSPMFDFMGVKGKVWSIGLGIWFLLGAGIAFVCESVISAKTATTQPSFFITKTWQSGGPASNGWFVDDCHPNMRRATKADGQFLVEFTNLKPTPIMIAAYAISERTADGQWKAAETFRLGSLFHGRFLSGNDLTKVREIKYQTFDDAIEGKHIATNETVRGWIIFKRWPEGELQFELRDMTGIVTTEPFSPSILDDFKLTQSVTFPAQPMLMVVNVDETEDISSLPKW
jgi:hypothetical protein